MPVIREASRALSTLLQTASIAALPLVRAAALPEFD
jgi:hypothetical protein